ncbi:MAG: hypothetical protein ACRDYV_05225 [Acidimicrobiia bacterium]
MGSLALLAVVVAGFAVLTWALIGVAIEVARESDRDSDRDDW